MLSEAVLRNRNRADSDATLRRDYDDEHRPHLSRRGGRIDGNVTSKTLVVEEGGVLHGQSIMDGGSGAAPQQGKAAQPAQADAKGDQVKVP